MKKRALGLLALTAVVSLLSAAAAGAKNADVSISGAGSSLVNPLVQQWIQPVGSAFGYSLTYASVGSGTGIADITARTVDFGASDAPLNPIAGRSVQRLHRDPLGALGDDACRTTCRALPTTSI